MSVPYNRLSVLGEKTADGEGNQGGKSRSERGGVVLSDALNGKEERPRRSLQPEKAELSVIGGGGGVFGVHEHAHTAFNLFRTLNHYQCAGNQHMPDALSLAYSRYG